MKFTIAVLLFVFVTCGFFKTFAQDDTVRFAKIKLENDVSIKGYLLQDINSNNLILKTHSGNTFSIDMNDVKKVKFGKYGTIDQSKKDVKIISINNIYEQRIGIYNIFGFGLNFSEYSSRISLTTEVGKRFNKNWALGLAINYDRDYLLSNLPIYLSGRAYLNNKKIAPFAYAGLGYSLAWANDPDDFYQINEVRGGYMGQLGIGYQINFSGLALLLNLGYKVQKVYQDYSYNEYYYAPWSRLSMPMSGSGEPNVNVKEKRLLRRAEFKVSFLF